MTRPRLTVDQRVMLVKALADYCDKIGGEGRTSEQEQARALNLAKQIMGSKRAHFTSRGQGIFDPFTWVVVDRPGDYLRSKLSVKEQPQTAESGVSLP